ncbi:MAG TPA: mechanosensitive ion channel family protein [Terracidiphilus sp.]|nr:mechanosensitive ion channel family protein [Terracidiphilus sp.]
MIQYFAHNWIPLLWSAGILCGAVVVALIAHFIVFRVLGRIVDRKHGAIGRSILRHGKTPTRWVFPLLAVLAVLPGVPLPKIAMTALEHITGLGLIAAIAWFVLLFIDIVQDVFSGRYRVDVSDNLLARRVQTQFMLLHRVAMVLVILVAVSIMLMTFPVIRHIGMSLLASAGLATLVVGIAMKGTLSNLIAGVQIAFTQPFRLEDAVVIEGEWGWIEEIGTMYVVVRIWDLRRLVLPLSYFLDHPFQNWTRNSADLLGSTILYADYTVPMDELRAELKRICESTKLWKGEVCVLQTTDATEHTVQLRALTDARNSSDAWDLRCLVREKLLAYLQKNHPGSLPRYRGELREIPSRDGSNPQSVASTAPDFRRQRESREHETVARNSAQDRGAPKRIRPLLK